MISLVVSLVMLLVTIIVCEVVERACARARWCADEVVVRAPERWSGRRGARARRWDEQERGQGGEARSRCDGAHHRVLEANVRK